MTTRYASRLFLVLLFSLAIVPRAEGARTFALIIGNNASLGQNTPALRYADDDAAQYANFFGQLGSTTHLLVEFDEASRNLYPYLRPEGAPTRGALDDALTAIGREVRDAKALGEKTVFYFVYAGHGDVKRGEGRIALKDGAITRDHFYKRVLGRSYADINHVIIDACKSYFLVFDRGEDETREAYHQRFDDEELVKRPNTGLFLSTSAAKNSHEWEQYQAGVFSHEVRSGLRGGADLNLDGQVSYQELAAFVYSANKSIPNEKYRPDFLAVPPESDAPLVDLTVASGRRVVLDTHKPGRLLAEGADGIRLLDLHLGPQKAQVILPMRDTVFLQNVDDALEYLLPAEPLLLLSRLRARAPTMATRGAAHEAFGKLFGTPFDQQVLAQLPHIGSFLDRKTLAQKRIALESRVSVARPRPLTWIGLGASAAFAGLGVAFRIHANNQFGAFQRASASEQARLESSTERWDRLAIASWTLAATTALAALVYELWFADPSASDHAAE